MPEPWDLSTQRAMRGGRAETESLLRGPGGRALCRWCGLEVPAGRRTFCSNWCVHEWRLRTDPGYLRAAIFERDKGKCALCRLDTDAEWKRIRRMSPGRRAGALRDWGLRSRTRSSLWDADHIVPVVEGGGECDVSNMRTLCLRCHRKATGELRSRLQAAKERSVAGISA